MSTTTTIYKHYTKNYSVSIDTRTLKKDDVFFAIKGDNFDGNIYAKKAIELGAIAVIVDNEKYLDAKCSNIILVKNSLQTLQELAHFHRKKLQTKIISITGSNGKTTTKELIKCVLSQKYNTIATKGNLNNHIGVPLTLLSIKPNCEFAVVEMGANHIGEIEFLCSLAEPDFGYITNFGKAHLEGFGGQEGVIKGKKELYNFLKANDKIAFVNADNDIQSQESKDIKTIEFSKEKQSFINIKLLESNPFVKVLFDKIQVNSNLIGNYNFDNISSAITIGKYLNINNLDIKNAIENYIPKNNRSQIIVKNNCEILLDAYNANPTSMRLSIDNFSKLRGEKSIIIGDMFELGKYAEKEHQQIVDSLTEYDFDKIFLVGENFHKTKVNSDKIIKFEKTEAILNFLKNSKNNFERLLIKGSRGMKLEKVLDIL